jgi:hypothetical protein
MESLNSTLQDLEARNSILETSMEKAPTEDHICTGELEQKLKASEEQLQLQECTVTTFKSDVVAKLYFLCFYSLQLSLFCSNVFFI